MANSWYSKGLEGFGNGQVNWPTDDCRADLLDAADYTVSLTADEFWSSVPAAARVSTVTLAGKTNALGILDATDAVFPTVVGDQSELISVRKYNASDAASRLLWLYDTATGLPVLPNGGNINAAWDNGANKMAAL